VTRAINKIAESDGLAPLAPGDYEAQSIAERRQEAFYLVSTGHRVPEVARMMGVKSSAIEVWLETESEIRFRRADNREAILERVAGTMEAIIDASWEGYRAMNGSTSLAGPNYLRTALDAARELARLRGLNDATERVSKTVSVVVNIGKDVNVLDAEPDGPDDMPIAELT
jgi:predicted transcriptional regulator